MNGLQTSIGIAVLTIAASSQGQEKPYDFIISFDECKTPISALVLTESEPITVFDGDTFFLMCTQQAKRVVCEYKFSNGANSSKANIQDYALIADVPPYLMFGAENGSDYVVVNKPAQSAGLISRQLGETYVGAKVCHGFYSTYEQLQEASETPQ